MTKPDITGHRWVAIYQSLFSSSIWTDTTSVGKCLAVWLIVHANYAMTRWHGITINRGQQFRSISNLAEDLCCSRKSLGRNLRALEQLEFISLFEAQGKNRGFLITIKNYCKYQFASETDHGSDEQCDSQADYDINGDYDEFEEGPAPGIFTNGSIYIPPRTQHHWKMTLLQNYIKALLGEKSDQASNVALTGVICLWQYCAEQQKVEFEDMTPEKLWAIVELSLDPKDIWNVYIKAQLIEETENGIRVLTEELLEPFE